MWPVRKEGAQNAFAVRDSVAGSSGVEHRSGLEGRVEFHLRDAADEEFAGNYDFVYIHEALHHMSYPVDVLAACRDCSPTAAR